MNSVKENYVNKSSFVNLLRAIFVKYLAKSSITIGTVYRYIFSFLYQFSVKSKACHTHSIQM